jgi:peptide/nickel transport system permease protein
MLSISSLFYIIVGQYLFSRVLKLAPISGYAPGLDAVKFLVLPIGLSAGGALGGEARFCTAPCSWKRSARTMCAPRAPRAWQKAR